MRAQLLNNILCTVFINNLCACEKIGNHLKKAIRIYIYIVIYSDIYIYIDIYESFFVLLSVTHLKNLNVASLLLIFGSYPSIDILRI